MSAYDRVLGALEDHVKVWRRGEQSRSQCPSHESRGVTLSIRHGGGRVSLHCFAGCTEVSILDVIGLEIRDLFDEPRSQAPEYVPLCRPDVRERASSVRDSLTLALYATVMTEVVKRGLEGLEYIVKAISS